MGVPQKWCQGDQDLCGPMSVAEVPAVQPGWRLLLVAPTLLREEFATPGPSEATVSASRFPETTGSSAHRAQYPWSTVPTEHSAHGAQYPGKTAVTERQTEPVC